MQTIKTALCSFGMSGWVFHAPFLNLHKGFELYGVWERSKKTAAEKYPSIKSFDTYEALLSDEAIELVIVNTPNFTHFDLAKKALLADKNVIVEKPFCITVTECDELIALAKEKNKLLSVYQNRRYDSDYKIIKKVVNEGWLGDIVEAEFHFDRFSEILSPKVHKETPGPGTGLLYDLGAHLIDQALQLFGMPEAVFADIYAARKISLVDDYMELLLFYTSMRVRIKASYVVREPLPSYALHGTKGSFIKARTDVQEKALQAGLNPDMDNWGKEPENEMGLLHTEKDGQLIREYLPAANGNYMDYYDGVYKALTTGADLPVTAEEGRDVIRVIEKAYQSNQEKRVINL
ncbi:Gfo/Idh/MocA family oxidoreductase [Ferruginibacter sp. SUN106]|uniref:Gfo/Idh/MocA family oxidoreductase n=1 Tax=Ferruginibacter sp. SUN106 TaxID=2978348 RepID=UPI003D361442